MLTMEIRYFFFCIQTQFYVRIVFTSCYFKYIIYVELKNKMII